MHDAPLITTIAELRALDVPGARHASAPAIVVLGGYSAQADGGWSVWKYNTASTRTDNGITVVIPTNNTSGTGAWERAPSQIRLTTTARDALSLGSADAGLTIWNTSTTETETWDGATWTTGGGGGTQNGSTHATQVPYASADNVLADTGITWDPISKVLTLPAGSKIDGDSIIITGGTNPAGLGPSAGHYIAVSSTAVDTPGGDLDLSLGGPGSRRFRGLWNGGRLTAGYNAQSGTSYTAVTEDCTINMTNTAARAVTLYAANSVTAGTELRIKDGAGTAATANITISAGAGDTIDGAATLVINTNKGKAVLVSDGVSKWIAVG